MLTEVQIKALQAPKKGEKIYPDKSLPGFGVRVTSTGVKSFILTHGRTRSRETIGRTGMVSLAEARAEAKRRLAEYTLGKQRPQTKSWRAAVDEYLEAVKAKNRESTFKSYDRHLRKHFRFGETRMEDVTPQTIQRALDKLNDRQAERHHAFTSLRAFIRWAHRRHYVDRNPMERMRAPRGSRARDRVLSNEELAKVWNACGEDTFAVIVKLLILTGQRVGEISKLRHDMVGERSLTLPAWLTKNGRAHTIPLPEAAAELLRGRQTAPDGRFFPAKGKSREPFSGWSKSKAALDKRSTVTDWTIHDLRRTFASGLASLGVALPVIEKLLNHISGSFGGIVGVYQRYDFMPEMRAAIEKWEAHVIKLASPEGVNPKGVMTLSNPGELHDAVIVEEAGQGAGRL